MCVHIRTVHVVTHNNHIPIKRIHMYKASAFFFLHQFLSIDFSLKCSYGQRVMYDKVMVNGVPACPTRRQQQPCFYAFIFVFLYIIVAFWPRSCTTLPPHQCVLDVSLSGYPLFTCRPQHVRDGKQKFSFPGFNVNFFVFFLPLSDTFSSDRSQMYNRYWTITIHREKLGSNMYIWIFA